jgi:hypothetical protein
MLKSLLDEPEEELDDEPEEELDDEPEEELDDEPEEILVVVTLVDFDVLLELDDDPDRDIFELDPPKVIED